MNVLEILDEVRMLSGRFNDPRLTNAQILRWINRYKKSLQRDRRYRFSFNTAQIVARQNVRSSDLPSNFLSMIAVRRSTGNIVTTSFDSRGNRIVKVKQTVLNPHMSKEAFLDKFPVSTGDGYPNIGIPNEYMIQGNTLIWGPIPSQSETFYIDYYRFFPDYNDTTNIADDFTEFYDDGLLAFAMTEIFRSWIENEKKLNEWEKALVRAEKGLRAHQIANENPEESDINLPDN